MGPPAIATYAGGPAFYPAEHDGDLIRYREIFRIHSRIYFVGRASSRRLHLPGQRSHLIIVAPGVGPSAGAYLLDTFTWTSEPNL